MNIIQIGANDGKDHVRDFISQNSNSISSAVIVEALPHFIPVIKEVYSAYPQVEVVNLAIVPDSERDGSTISFFHKTDGDYGISSINKSHITDFGFNENIIKEITVSATTLMSLIQKYGFEKVDHLFIDTEGLDIDIINSIDFSKVKILNIFFESMHSDGVRHRGAKFEALKKKLEGMGYSVTSDWCNSTASLTNN